MGTKIMSTATAKDEWRVGWPVVLGAALGLGSGHSVYNFISSLFVQPLAADFGWSRGDIAGVVATGLVAAALAPFIGLWADRKGVRPVLLIAVIGFALSYFALSFMTGSLTQFYVIMAIFGVFGMATTGMTYTRAVNSWFDRNRGLALGVSLAGVSVIAFVIPPLLNTIIADYGWRNGYRLMGVIALVFGIPAVLFLVREKDRAPGASRTAAADTVSWNDVLTAPAFWLLLLGMILINVPGNGMMNQMQPILTDRGLTKETAAWAISLYGISIFVGRLTFGYLIDHMPAPLVGAFVVGAPAIGAALLVGPEASTSVAFMAIAFLGLSQGAEMDLTGYFLAKYFGLGKYATLFSVIVIGLVISNVLGARLFGQLFDVTGSYDQALIYAIGLFLLGALCILGIKWCTPRAASAVAPQGI
jgi:MFS family permease